MSEYSYIVGRFCLRFVSYVTDRSQTEYGLVRLIRVISSAHKCHDIIDNTGRYIIEYHNQLL